MFLNKLSIIIPIALFKSRNSFTSINRPISNFHVHHSSDTTAYVAEIINAVGQASAAAQGLNQPVTTAERLRNTEEQVIYLMTEDNDKK